MLPKWSNTEYFISVFVVVIEVAIGEYGTTSLKKLIDLAPKYIYTNDQHHCHTVSANEYSQGESSKLSFQCYNTFY